MHIIMQHFIQIHNSALLTNEHKTGSLILNPNFAIGPSILKLKFLGLLIPFLKLQYIVTFLIHSSVKKHY